MLKGLAILFSCQLAGEVMARLFHLPLPGPVLGLMLLFGILCGRKTVPSTVQTASHLLLENLALLFVPAGVGVIAFTGLLRSNWLPLLVAILVSTVLTIAITAGLLCLLMKGKTRAETTVGTAREFETELEE